jgi:hypothetical protein
VSLAGISALTLNVTGRDDQSAKIAPVASGHSTLTVTSADATTMEGATVMITSGLAASEGRSAVFPWV